MKRIYQADFIRAVSTLGIFYFHFWSKARENQLLPYASWASLPNFTLGSLFVTVFFILSGSMLYYTSENKPLSAVHFYWHRFLGIFPAFYLVFFPLHLKAALEQGSFFYKGNPGVFLLSLLGMDGYLNYRISTYYQIGEWFLGALLLLYLLYPLLHRCISIRPWLTSGILLLLYCSIFFIPGFRIDSFQNLFSCLFSFWLGMMIMKYRGIFLEHQKPGWISGLLFLFLLFIKLPFNTNILSHIGGFLCFCALYTIGTYLPQKGIAGKAIYTCSILSYPVYLVHHVIISVILNRIQGQILSGSYLALLFLATLSVTLITAWLLHLILMYSKKFLCRPKTTLK